MIEILGDGWVYESLRVHDGGKSGGGGSSWGDKYLLADQTNAATLVSRDFAVALLSFAISTSVSTCSLPLSKGHNVFVQ